MGQIVSSAAKPKRCNANQLSQVPTPAAGEYILVSSDNSMNAAGQGNFDCYIKGDGQKAATALELRPIAKGEIANGEKDAVNGSTLFAELYDTIEGSTVIDVTTAGGWNAMMFDQMLPAGTIITGADFLTTFYFTKANGSYFQPAITASTTYPFTLEQDAYGVTSNIAISNGKITYASPSYVSKFAKIEEQIEDVSDSVTENTDAINAIEEELTTTKEGDVPISVNTAGGWNAMMFDQMLPAGTIITGADFLTTFYFTKANGSYFQPAITASTTYPFTLEQDAYGVTSNIAISNGKITYKGEVEVNRLDELDANVEELKQEVGNLAVEIICPSTIYAVVGKELNLYYDALFKAMDDGLKSPFGYYLDIRMGKNGTAYGVRRDRCWQIESVPAALLGTNTITIEVYNNKNELVASKEVRLNVVANSIRASHNILLIGDSTTNNGNLPKYTSDQFIAAGLAQNFVGTRERNGVKHEGWPGYTTGSFVHAEATNYYIFQVPTNSVASAGDVYSDGTRTFTVADLFQESAETLALRCTLTSGSGSPSATGTLTKVSGQSSSSASMAYSDVDYQNGNPFWNASNNSVDFAYYRNKIGLASQLDAVVIMLGVNDCLSAIATETSIANLQTLVTAIHADSPNCKVIIQLVTNDANTISGWQAYSASFTYSRKWRYQKYVWLLRKSICETFTGQNVYVGQAALGLDRFYGYPYTTTAVNSHVSTTEILHTNCVHPSDEGYHMLADGYFMQLMNVM